MRPSSESNRKRMPELPRSELKSVHINAPERSCVKSENTGQIRGQLRSSRDPSRTRTLTRFSSNFVAWH
jgi:hypothetical protein